jgi:hypothetical protein
LTENRVFCGWVAHWEPREVKATSSEGSKADEVSQTGRMSADTIERSYAARSGASASNTEWRWVPRWAWIDPLKPALRFGAPPPGNDGLPLPVPTELKSIAAPCLTLTREASSVFGKGGKTFGSTRSRLSQRHSASSFGKPAASSSGSDSQFAVPRRVLLSNAQVVDHCVCDHLAPPEACVAGGRIGPRMASSAAPSPVASRAFSSAPTPFVFQIRSCAMSATNASSGSPAAEPARDAMTAPPPVGLMPSAARGGAAAGDGVKGMPSAGSAGTAAPPLVSFALTSYDSSSLFAAVDGLAFGAWLSALCEFAPPAMPEALTLYSSLAAGNSSLLGAAWGQSRSMAGAMAGGIIDVASGAAMHSLIGASGGAASSGSERVRAYGPSALAGAAAAASAALAAVDAPPDQKVSLRVGTTQSQWNEGGAIPITAIGVAGATTVRPVERTMLSASVDTMKAVARKTSSDVKWAARKAHRASVGVAASLGGGALGLLAADALSKSGDRDETGEDGDSEDGGGEWADAGLAINPQFEIGVTVSVAPLPFYRTKLVTFCPRIILVNRLHLPIHLLQACFLPYFPVDATARAIIEASRREGDDAANRGRSASGAFAEHGDGRWPRHRLRPALSFMIFALTHVIIHRSSPQYLQILLLI